MASISAESSNFFDGLYSVAKTHAKFIERALRLKLHLAGNKRTYHLSPVKKETHGLDRTVVARHVVKPHLVL